MEWLANLSVQWVLPLLAIVLLLRFLLVRTARSTAGVQVAAEALEATATAISVVFLIVRPYLFQAYFIPSESMRPTLLESDRILVNRLLYRLRPPRRGELVVFRPPDVPQIPDPSKDYVKRVIGLPGDRVEVSAQEIQVDGRTALRLLPDPPGLSQLDQYPAGANLGMAFPVSARGVTVREREVRLTAGIGSDLRVLVLPPSQVVQFDAREVTADGQVLLSVVHGPLQVGYGLSQWGGDPGLAARVFSENGYPRLIVVEGRKIEYRPAQVLVNGAPLVETYLAEPPSYAVSPLIVPPGSLWVLGDNRNHSLDSHVWGPLPQRQVLGRAEVRFWPPDRLAWLGPGSAGR